MTATRVITDHSELDNIGQHTHAELDAHVDQTPFLIVSGTGAGTPTKGRNLKAGPGIILNDAGPGGDLTVSVAAVTGSLPTPTMIGQLLFAATETGFVPALPITSQTAGVLVNDLGYMLVSASL